MNPENQEESATPWGDSQAVVQNKSTSKSVRQARKPQTAAPPKPPRDPALVEAMARIAVLAGFMSVILYALSLGSLQFAGGAFTVLVPFIPLFVGSRRPPRRRMLP